MNIDKIIEAAKTITEDINIVIHREQHTLMLKHKNTILLILDKMRAIGFDMLIDITAIDWAKQENRFDVVYFLYSNEHKMRLRIKVPINENECNCPSAVEIYPSADWYERETYDMYGIIFEEHPDLRRFYMPEDFFNKKTMENYYPLRKDFPLMGYPNEMALPPFPEKTGIEVDW